MNQKTVISNVVEDPDFSLDKYIQPSDTILQSEDEQIRKDIITLIAQYLNDQGFTASKMLLLDEANMKRFEGNEQSAEIKRLKKAILGAWVSFRGRMAGS